VRWSLLDYMLALAIAGALAAIGCGIYLIYLNNVSPDLAVLKRHEWVCTKSELRLQPLPNNQFLHLDECVEYRRK
jgi:hypothetical protein